MTYVEGVDLSNYQHVTPSLTGESFVIAKATEGTSFVDPYYAQHVAAAVAAGDVHGAYHFGHTDLDPVAQADFFLAHAPDAQFVALDSEGRARMTVAQEQAFFGRIAAVRPALVGRRLLYESQSGFDRAAGQDANWVAVWGSTPPTVPWLFWQYTSNGTLGASTQRLDLDRFNGTLDQLRAFAGVTPPVPVSWTLHVAAHAKVHVATMRGSCISGWTEHLWGPKASSAPCRAPVVRKGCYSGSATVAYVTKGLFAGKYVRISASDGVTATHS